MNSLRFATSLVVVSGLALSSWHAVAATNQDPEALIREGVELRRQGQDARAEGYFQRAHELAGTPRTAAQLGLVELALKQYLRAEGHLSEALSSQDAWVLENHRSLEDSRGVARKHLLRIEISNAPRGAAFAGGDGAATVLPADGVLWFEPGAAMSLRLEAPGRKAAQVRVEAAAAGETRRISVDMPALIEPPKEVPPLAAPAPAPALATSAPTPDASTSPRPDAGRRLKVAGIAVASVGVATGIVGVVLLAKGLSERDDIVAASQSHGMTAYNPSDANWSTLRAAGIGCIVGGAVGLAAGAGLYFYGKRASSEGGATVSFLPTSGFGVFSYQRNF